MEIFVRLEGLKKIYCWNFGDAPTFLRFDQVELSYRYLTHSQRSIEETCDVYGNDLQLLKVALNDTNLTVFDGVISSNAFRSHSNTLDYIHSRLLQICDSSRGYKFRIGLESDESASKRVIESLLQKPQILTSSNVEIIINEVRDLLQTELPVKIITDWLHCDSGAGNFKGNGRGKKNKRVLRIHARILNARETCSFLKEVYYLQFIGHIVAGRNFV